ncbi:helix-hairpin-helix domain-containing protein [Nesterenkonia natronophila]|uniref:ComEA family DNA-binding protein n=1 Tax=Nesterenkonia natronophila TaxID=2174932 RepID=A0A3A4EZ62_9MICC|nr:helix-hairpin-helix domain-containing protein [Nesterenkonia natronophila]RJN31153.1 ComEA family DNA-binding protein [Nesterenkonia natronophila]
MELHDAGAEADALLTRRERLRAERQHAHSAPMRFGLRLPAVLVLVAGLVTWVAVSWITAGPSDQSLPEPPSIEDTAEPRPKEQPQQGRDSTDVETPEAPALVHVTGAVHEPQVVQLEAGDRVADAVEAAGGLLTDAAPEGANLAAPVVDGSMIYVPTVEELKSGRTPPAAAGADGQGEGNSRGPVNLNSAGSEELEQLPGIGPALAERIIEHREEHGRFSSLEQLAAVSGVGPAIIENIVDDVTW